MADSGRSQNNTFLNNTVSGGRESIKLKEADGTTFQENIFINVTTIRFDNATETLMLANTGLQDVELKVVDGACFDEGSDSGFEPTC